MKAFVLVCLAAVAVAKPQVLLTNPIVGSPIVGSPLVNTVPLTYVQQPLVQVQQKATEEQKPIEVESYMAEEKKEEQAPIVYTTSPFTYGIPIAQQPIVQKVQLVPRYQAKNGEVEHTVLKREAEPQLLLNSPLMYRTPIVSSPVVSPVVYSSPVISAPLAQPVVYKQEVANPLAGVEAKTYANDFNLFGRNYAAKGQYIADSVGARHVAKREAEADPALLYRSLGYNYINAPVRSVYSTWAARPYVSSYASPIYNPYAAARYYF